MSYANDRRAWALSYLAGRVHAFTRGRLPLNNVAGAARLAQRCGATARDIAAAVERYGVVWDEELEELVSSPSSGSVT